MIYTGDCIEVMRGMPEASVDAVVTDPPYGLEFMGKAWDSAHRLWSSHQSSFAVRPNGGTSPFEGRERPNYQAGIPFQAWCEAWGREALRVTKPGGYLLAFGGTRTHHRLVCGLEDAGWIIRDELDWIYASGFPKGKANLKPAHEPIVLARKPGPLRPLGIDAGRLRTDDLRPYSPGLHRDSPSSFNDDAWQGREEVKPAPVGRWPSNLLLSDPELFDEPNPEVVGSGATVQGAVSNGKSGVQGAAFGKFGPVDQLPSYGDTGGYSRFFAIPRRDDESVRAVAEEDDQSGIGRAEREGSTDGSSDSEGTPAAGGLAESYPRYFLIPKADRADREPVVRGQLTEREGADPMAGHRGRRMAGDVKVRPDGKVSAARSNLHPTVKPVDLMRHLIRLVCPPGGTILDCFAGSGSTLIAAELEGFPWIAIEKDESYVEIMRARLNGTQRGLGLDVGAPIRPHKISTEPNPTEARHKRLLRDPYAYWGERERPPIEPEGAA